MSKSVAKTLGLLPYQKADSPDYIRYDNERGIQGLLRMIDCGKFRYILFSMTIIKRLRQRHKRRYPVKLGLYKPLHDAFTEDISAKGLFIKTTKILSVGTHILIDLTLPNDSTVSIKGMVCWAKLSLNATGSSDDINKCGMGVEIKGFIVGEEIYRQHIAELNTIELNSIIHRKS